MPLLSQDDVLSYLACPACRSRVERGRQRYACSSSDCRFAAPEGFPFAGQQPVLVDFDSSILSEEEVVSSGGRSVIERETSRPVARAVLKALMPSNRIAASNAMRLKQLARTDAKQPILLIVGGGSTGAGTECLYEDQQLGIISFDIYASPLTQFVGDAHRIPLRDESVDAVWIQAVLEHVLDPWSVVSEIHRVLKPQGVVYAETPFMQQVHEGAYDFTRFTASGHRWMFRKFDEIDSGAALGPATQFLWSVDHLVRSLFRSVKAGAIAKLLLFWVKYLDRLAEPSFSLDGASAVYFLGRKGDRELGPKDMVDYYKGAHRRTGH